MSRMNDDLVMRFLDGDLSGEEEARALRRIAADPEARALLRFDEGLRRVLGGSRPKGPRTVPEGFTARVMRAIEAHETARRPVGRPEGQGLRPALGRLWGSLTRPRTLVWQPVHALAAAAVVLVAGVTAVTLLDPLAGPSVAEEETAWAPVAGAPDTVLVRFAFEEPAAGSVAVAGDFSHWEPVPLSPRWSEGRRVWTGVMAIPRGEHRYMFVVDGSEWVTDPLATAVKDDGFGGQNAILSL